MSIGPDLKEAINEVGSALTAGSVSEKIKFTINSQVTKPFIREYFVEATLVYDTALNVGDVVTITVTGDKYRLMNKTPDMFENQVIRYGAVLYKCNVVGTFQRLSEERGADLKITPTWAVVSADVSALMTEALYGHDLETDQALGELEVQNHELYIASSHGIQVKDRFYISADEYLKVVTIKRRRYPAVDVCEVEVDTRK